MCYEIICDHIHNIVDHIHNSVDHFYNRANHMQIETKFSLQKKVVRTVEKPSGQTTQQSKPATATRLRHSTDNDVSSCYATNVAKDPSNKLIYIWVWPCYMKDHKGITI